MRGDFRRWLTGPGAPRRQRRRPRLTGCLLWLLILVVVLVVLSLLFGGFRKGTKVGGAGHPAPVPIGRLSPQLLTGGKAPGTNRPAAPRYDGRALIAMR